MKHAYSCPECDGAGLVPCDCCGGEVECDVCEGSGYDAERIDVSALRAAQQQIGPAMTWAWIEDGEYVGREGSLGRVRFSEFEKVSAR